MNYTTAQKKAISTHDQNLQIIACAGSGKTQVISERIVDILRTKGKQGIGPDNIVAFTFTDKADRRHRYAPRRSGQSPGGYDPSESSDSVRFFPDPHRTGPAHRTDTGGKR
jgi:hypothetical protein